MFNVLKIRLLNVHKMQLLNVGKLRLLNVRKKPLLNVRKMRLLKVYVFFLNSVDVISHGGQLTSFRRLCFQNLHSLGLFVLQPEGNTQTYLFQDQWWLGVYIRICKTHCREVNPTGMEQKAQRNNIIFFVFKTPGPGCSKDSLSSRQEQNILLRVAFYEHLTGAFYEHLTVAFYEH